MSLFARFRRWWNSSTGAGINATGFSKTVHFRRLSRVKTYSSSTISTNRSELSSGLTRGYLRKGDGTELGQPIGIALAAIAAVRNALGHEAQTSPARSSCRSLARNQSCGLSASLSHTETAFDTFAYP